MSPYCSAHVEWLILKLCMYVGYHDANNVSTFGGDVVTKLNFKTRFKKVMRDLQRRKDKNDDDQYNYGNFSDIRLYHFLKSYALSHNSWQTITIATVNMQITTRHTISNTKKNHFITFRGDCISRQSYYILRKWYYISRCLILLHLA